VCPDVVVGDELVLDCRMERFQQEGFRVPALDLDQATANGELAERVLLFLFQEEIVGGGVHILARLEVEGESQIRVSQGREADQAGLLVDQDNPLAEFAHLTEEHVHNRFPHAGGLAVEDMVRFFDGDLTPFERYVLFPVGDLHENVPVTGIGSAPTTENLSFQFSFGGINKIGPFFNKPLAVFLDDLLPRSIRTNLERVPPFGGPSDVDVIF
jgi:hypothetical protein